MVDDSNWSRGIAGSKEDQDWLNFSFPSISGTITGIEVKVRGGRDPREDNAFFNISLSGYGGELWSDKKEAEFKNSIESPTSKTYGSSSDTWNESWSPSNFEDGNFLVYFEMTELIMYVEAIWVRVHYEPDDTPPDITINFAGNLGDQGGPYWRPPGESTQLSGVWKHGYYANSSLQTEDFIYINTTITDDSNIDTVYLNLYTLNSWENWTHTLINSGGDFYEFNSSGNTTLSGDTSFNIIANDTYGNSKTVWWNKTGIGGIHTRRYVNFGSRIVNISYTPYYFYKNNIYGSADQNKEDRLKFDQGAEGTAHDTGKLLETIPDDSIDFVWCDSFFGYWFGEDVAIDPTTIENIYYHFWWSSDTDELLEVGYNVSREDLTYPKSGQYYSTDYTNQRSYMFYDNHEPSVSNDYYLETNKFDNSDLYFTDNSIYELAVSFLETPEQPSSISNRSIISFVIFNLPSDEELQSMDTDNDGLTDYVELFRTYTSPFLEDTDNDGFSDFSEDENNTDPNNYTDYPITEFIWLDVTPSQWNLGTVQMNNQYYTNDTGNTFTAVKDNCTVYTDLSLQITNDASDWSAATSGNGPGADTY
ncbi:MAG: hypothetical protein ACOC80_07120, partial [Petrotogales bacterium]